MKNIVVASENPVKLQATMVFDRTNSKHSNGAIGLLTNDVIDRTRYYTEAVVFALIPFKNPDLYKNP